MGWEAQWVGGWCSPAEVEICSREKEVLDWAQCYCSGPEFGFRLAGRPWGFFALFSQAASERLWATIIK